LTGRRSSLKNKVNWRISGIPSRFYHASHFRIWLSLALAAACGAGLYILVRFDLYHQITTLVNERTPPGLFIALMLVLPMVGAPMSLFLFLLGLKFGIAYGLLILGIIMPVQILIAYAVARVFRSAVETYLVVKKGYRIPRIPSDRAFFYSVFFLAFPGVPYAPKLYLLPLAAIPFNYCFWLNWAIQGTLAIPFVMLGKSAADMSLVLFGLTVAVFLVLILVLRWTQKRYRREGDPESTTDII
jgi:uncharacterized membrane protein YdjX (TVP38/TMEM64 family)